MSRELSSPFPSRIIATPITFFNQMMPIKEGNYQWVQKFLEGFLFL